MSGLLRGVRVVDFTQNLPGPYASFMLASWGADVIKVEPPKGDPGRHMEPFFSMMNRGKRSIVLDLRDQSAQRTVRALIAKSDVVMEGFRPGVITRLGCDYASLRASNPRLIYCSISAHGQDGPRRDEPGHDLNLQALAGVCDLERDARGQPRYSMLPIADLSSSMLAVAGICAALRERDQSGEGRYLDVAMADGVLSWANTWGVGVDVAANARRASRSPAMSVLARPFVRTLERMKLYALPHYGVYRCRGDRWISIGIVDEGHFWKSFCEVLGLPARVGAMGMAARTMAGPALKPVIAARLRMGERSEWLARFREAGVPASAVLSPGETKDDPQFRFRGMIDERGHARSPLPLAERIEGAVPALGEHTEEILRELG